ncbi:transposase [Saccharothrix sp. NEAU-S10]|nr:transposase [Saccharothrix luteola]MCC8244980.1 transposase [Saccharothrix luteola]
MAAGAGHARRDHRLGLPSRSVVADAGYGDTTTFRLVLTERGLAYALAVHSNTTAHPASAVP